MYSKAEGVPRVLGGMGIAILSTNQGLLTDREARERKRRRRSPLPGLVAELVMSRIGKQPITVPSGVDVTIDGAQSRVKGPKGQLELRRSSATSRSTRDGDTLNVTRADDTRSNRSLHGLQRTLIANMVIGVSEGFVKELEIVGVGYRAAGAGPERRSSSQSASRTR